VVLETANEGRLTGARARAAAQVTDPGLDDLIETIVAWTHKHVGDAGIVQAAERFYQDNGKVFHDDTFYDTRMSYFFDALVFERPMPAEKATPYELFLAQARAGQPPFAPAVIERLTWLGDFRHSLFQIVKLQEKSLTVVDLIGTGKLTVSAKPGETFRGLDKRNLLQGFLFRFGDEQQLSAGLILHPQKVTRVVKRYLKTAQKAGTFSRRAALAKLASVNLRHLRHRHVEPKAIYQNELK
jgi:hypothetical protein